MISEEQLTRHNEKGIILFDMDGTLWDFCGSGRVLGNETVKSRHDNRKRLHCKRSVSNGKRRWICDLRSSVSGSGRKANAETSTARSREKRKWLSPDMQEQLSTQKDILGQWNNWRKISSVYYGSNLQSGIYEETFLVITNCTIWYRGYWCYGNNENQKGRYRVTILQANALDDAVYVVIFKENYDASMEAERLIYSCSTWIWNNNKDQGSGNSYILMN